MSLTIIALLAVYLSITLYFYTNWLKFFRRSSTLSPENWFLSIVLLAIVMVLWPFVMPINLMVSFSSFIGKRLFYQHDSEETVSDMMGCVDVVEKA